MLPDHAEVIQAMTQKLNVNLGGLAELSPEGNTFIEFATLASERLRHRSNISRGGHSIEVTVTKEPA